MLGGDIDILAVLLLPLAGPDQFSDEENDQLPLDLQYLPDDKEREPSRDIRKMLLETLIKVARIVCVCRFLNACVDVLGLQLSIVQNLCLGIFAPFSCKCLTQQEYACFKFIEYGSFSLLCTSEG